MAFRLAAGSLVIFFFGIIAAFAQVPKPKPAPKPAAPAFNGSVGIVTGDVDSTGIRIASDLARLLDDGTNLRIIPMIGKGSFQNIADLLTMRSADIAIIQSDVLSRFLKSNKQPGIETKLQYVTKLYSEEFHVLARMQFMCLQDLTGRRVSFGPKDSGMAITAEAVFQANNISVEPLYLDHEDAVEKIRNGEIDALVYIGGKPTRAFDRLSYKDRVHFLDVEYLAALQAPYLPAIITAEDYPSLVAPNESVATIGVSSVMAIFNAAAQKDRLKAEVRFVERFFYEFERLKGGSYSPKWREVDLWAPVKGWQRFQPAEAWISANARTKAVSDVRPQATQQLRTMLQKFVESQRGGNTTDQDKLFDQFVRWYQTQNQGVQAQ